MIEHEHNIEAVDEGDLCYGDQSIKEAAGELATQAALSATMTNEPAITGELQTESALEGILD